MPSTEVTILSLSSPELADVLMRGEVDLAFLRHEPNTTGVVFMSLYARDLLPPTVISRPIAGVAPTIDLSLGYGEAKTSRCWRL